MSNLLIPKNSVSPSSLGFAASLPPQPSTYNCRFLYPANDKDRYGIGEFETYPGRYTNTLFFLDKAAPADQLIRMLDYQKSIGATCIPFYIANDYARTWPTVNGEYNGAIDEDELNRWYAYCLAIIQNWGIWPFPMGHCSDNTDGYARLDEAGFRRVIKAIVTKLDPLVPAWGVGWEASEFWNPEICNAAAGIYHEFTSKPVIVHNQGWQHATGNNIQGLAYEWKHHPKYGQNISPADLKREYDVARNEMIKRGKGIIAGEWTVFTQTREAAAQRRAITGLPETYGTWN